jgi:hypothetical protein
MKKLMNIPKAIDQESFLSAEKKVQEQIIATKYEFVVPKRVPEVCFNRERACFLTKLDSLR